MNKSEALKYSQEKLKNISSQPYQESLWILSHVLKIPTDEIHFSTHKDLDESQKNTFFEFIQKRQEGFPLNYILEEKYFLNERFFIKPNVFIPRADSEVIIQEALKKNKNEVRGVDLGSGSGCLALSFLLNHKNSKFISVDINPQAIECISKNREDKKMKDRLFILEKNVLDLNSSDVENYLKDKPNLILSNPPYIRPNDPQMEKQVRFHESPIALFSDQEGMGHIISWFEKAMELLDDKGMYIFEFGYDQSEKVRNFLEKQNEIDDYYLCKDQGDRDRIAVCIKK